MRRDKRGSLDSIRPNQEFKYTLVLEQTCPNANRLVKHCLLKRKKKPGAELCVLRLMSLVVKLEAGR